MAKIYGSTRTVDTTSSSSVSVRYYNQWVSPVIHSSLVMVSIMIIYYSLY